VEKVVIVQKLTPFANKKNVIANQPTAMPTVRDKEITELPRSGVFGSVELN